MASRPGHFTLKERAYGTQWTVEWVGLDHAKRKKSLALLGLRPTHQPVITPT
jgi:hypothetical protein